MASHHGNLSHEEKKKIRSERKVLRKDLKLKGITKRQEFEEIAQMLGLVIYEDRPRLLFWWWRFSKWFLGLSAIKYFLMAGLALLLILPFAIMANQKGNFIVSMTDDLAFAGLELSDYQDLSITKTILKSEVLNEVNPFSIQDLPDDLNDHEGSHNLADVVAYTFWVHNPTNRTMGFDYYLILNNATRDIEEATWLMLYDENEMTIYAKESKDSGAERLTGCTEPPLIEQNSNPDGQYKEEADGSYTVIPKTYEDHNLVTRGTVSDLAPGESKKYTVVIWVEGDDPDCSSELVGGHGGYHMRFTSIGDEEDFNNQYSRYIK